MSPELMRLDEQLRSTFEGEAWHGPSVLDALDGVSPSQAAAHPLDRVHSIWELVLHLRGTYELVLRRVGGDGRMLTAAEDWPAVPAPTPENWTEAIAALKQLNDDLRRAVRNFPESRLDQPLVDEPRYSAYTQFIGITQHNLYHAGQMVLLKKSLGSSANHPGQGG